MRGRQRDRVDRDIWRGVCSRASPHHHGNMGPPANEMDKLKALARTLRKLGVQLDVQRCMLRVVLCLRCQIQDVTNKNDQTRNQKDRALVVIVNN